MKTIRTCFYLLQFSLVFVLGCNQINPNSPAPQEGPKLRCDSTLNTFQVIEWPRDSMRFSIPEYSLERSKAILQGKDVASFPWLANGFGMDIPPESFDGSDYIQYFKEGKILKDTCNYVLVWVHDPGTLLSLFLCKISSTCELLANERLAKSLLIPGLKISQSSTMKPSGEINSTTLNIAIEYEARLQNIPPDTIQVDRTVVLACE